MKRIRIGIKKKKRINFMLIYANFHQVRHTPSLYSVDLPFINAYGNSRRRRTQLRTAARAAIQLEQFAGSW